jgi:serine kinase of HPr protein (carbohydrate metabolism regulator)
VASTDTIKHEYFLNLFVSANQNVLISGNSGVGKSNLILNYLKNLK